MFIPYNNADDLTSFEWPQSNKYESMSFTSVSTRFDATETSARYVFSQYLFDPNRRRFSSGSRVMAIVMKFINNCRTQVANNRNPNTNKDGVCETYQVKISGESIVVILTDEELAHGKNYFFRKATAEVLQFAKESDYKKISTEKNGIFILPQ